MKKIGVLISLVLVLSMIFVSCSSDPFDKTMDKIDAYISDCEDAMKSRDEAAFTAAFKNFIAIDAEIKALVEQKDSLSEKQAQRFKELQTRTTKIVMLALEM